MSFGKCRMVMEVFIESQFNYCLLISMFHPRTLSSKVNHLHESVLRIVYFDYKSSFCELLESDKPFSISHKNIQSLAIEIYRFLHNFSPWIMCNIFKVNQTIPFNLRKRNVLQSRNLNSARYGHLLPKQSKIVKKSKLLQTKNEKVDA